MSSVIAGTVLKYMLAEFNNSQPEVYAHHKAVRDLIINEALRDYSLTDMDNCSCEWVLESPIDTQVCHATGPFVCMFYNPLSYSHYPTLHYILMEIQFCCIILCKIKRKEYHIGCAALYFTYGNMTRQALNNFSIRCTGAKGFY